MAKSDHKARAQDFEPSDVKRFNPLGRAHYLIRQDMSAQERAEAVLAMHCSGITALTRLLANSEAFRELNANCQTVEACHWPLDGQITEGLFAALLLLSEKAAELSEPS